jgi:hypothetical protein
MPWHGSDRTRTAHTAIGGPHTTPTGRLQVQAFLSARTAGEAPAVALSGYPLTDGPRLERNVVVGWISWKAPLLGEALNHSRGAGAGKSSGLIEFV